MKWNKNYNKSELVSMARLRHELQNLIFTTLFDKDAEIMREDVVKVLYQIIEEQQYLIISESECNKYIQKRVDKDTEV